MNRHSIRRHLLVLLIAALTLGVLIASAAVYVLARQEANDLFDYHLEQVAADRVAVHAATLGAV